jgi:hypothetical protein
MLSPVLSLLAAVALPLTVTAFLTGDLASPPATTANKVICVVPPVGPEVCVPEPIAQI